MFIAEAGYTLYQLQKEFPTIPSGERDVERGEIDEVSPSSFGKLVLSEAAGLRAGFNLSLEGGGTWAKILARY